MKEKGLIRVLDWTAMGAMGCLILGYIIFGSSFAELRAAPSFLSFPVFIGEMVMFLCGGLFFLKTALCRPGIPPRSAIFFALYTVFVLWKTAAGYVDWGPLALRHAALFYYPCFAFFAYFFFRPDMKAAFIRRILLVIVATLLAVGEYYYYWPLLLGISGVVLVWPEERKVIRIGGVVLLLVFAPWSKIFSDVRSVWLASFVTLVFIVLASALSFLSSFSRRARWGCVVAGLAAALALAGTFSSAYFPDTMDIPVIMKGIRRPAPLLSRPEPHGRYHLFNPDERTPEKSNSVLDLWEKMAPERGGGAVRSGAETALGPVVASGPAAVPGSRVGLLQNSPEMKLASEARREKSKRNREDGLDDPASENPATFPNSPRVLLAAREMGRRIMLPDWPGMQQVFPEMPQGPALSAAASVEDSPAHRVSVKQDNARYRLYLWRDMFREYVQYRPLFGFDFGWPLRAPTLKRYVISNFMENDGWVGAHNSFFCILYRAGLAGILIIGTLVVFWVRLVRGFVRRRDFTGILLCAILLNWMVTANFFLIFELPYTAIPFWVFFGLTARYELKGHNT